jgi:hypothetical protein
MRKAVGALGVLAVVLLLLGGTAFGASLYTAESTATANKPGTPKKPARFVATFSMTAKGTVDGERADAPHSFTYRWKGVRSHGAEFPTCSPEQIDAVQSDSVCPKGSLIAEAPFDAGFGLISDKTSLLACHGKILRVYNNGANAETWFLAGPPNDCNGIIYLAPFPGTVTTSGNTSTHKIPVPENVCHPLPGLECALGGLDYKPNLANIRIKRNGRTIDYMTSVRCKRQRRFTFIAHDTVTTTTLTANAGAC